MIYLFCHCALIFSIARQIRAIRETGGWFELKALFDGLIISYYSIIP